MWIEFDENKINWFHAGKRPHAPTFSTCARLRITEKSIFRGIYYLYVNIITKSENDHFNSSKSLCKKCNADMKEKLACEIYELIAASGLPLVLYKSFHDRIMSLRINWRFVFGNVMRCFTLSLWWGYFIYLKFTPVFF